MNTQRLLQCLRELLHPPRCAKYQPAPRLGTRRVERRLLRRLTWSTLETAQ